MLCDCGKDCKTFLEARLEVKIHSCCERHEPHEGVLALS